MLNNIRLITGEILLKKETLGRNAYYHFENDKILSGNDIHGLKIEIECLGLKIWFQRPFRPSFMTKEWYSGKYHALTNNSFKGKHHTEENKKTHSEFMTGRFVGEDNPFFGKKHDEKTLKTISEKCSGKFGELNPFFGKKHDEETRKIMSEKQTIIANNKIEKMREMGIISSQKQALGKKTSIEKKVEEQLKELLLPFKYNKIIKDVGQFDFIIGDNILLEVNGDYWHGNPKIYGDSKNKTPLNDRQKYKIQKDKEKRKAIKKLGYKIFYIWETDIKKEKWKVLNDIKSTINQI